jgi:hypothetical protein
MALDALPALTTGVSVIESAGVNAREPVGAGAPPFAVICTPKVSVPTVTPLFSVRIIGILKAPPAATT